MTSLRTAQSILLVLLSAACGDTVELGGPLDGGEAGRGSTTSTTGSNTGAGGSNSTGAGGDSNSGAGGDRPGTTGVGGNPGTTGSGGANTGVGGNPGTTGSGGSNTGVGGGPAGAGGAGGGQSCGGFSPNPATCPSGTYCDYPANSMCGAADQPGVCVPIPGGACTADCPGVCGCDGKFYCNACGAHMAGTDDSSDRSCIKDGGTPQVCGGLRGATCGAGMFCDFEPAAICGAADATGICRPRPQVCPADCPGVCGCDGKFYCSACVAQSMGFDDSPDKSCLRDR
jgi:hypothetical protein